MENAEESKNGYICNTFDQSLDIFTIIWRELFEPARQLQQIFFWRTARRLGEHSDSAINCGVTNPSSNFINKSFLIQKNLRFLLI